GQGWEGARAAGLALPLLLALLLALAGGGGAFYLEVRELEEKCFIQEIPDGTVVIGNYKTELYDPAVEKYQPSPQWINLFVFVKDPENKNLLSRQYGPRGSFTFTSQSPGEHQICLHLESIRFALFYDGKLAIHLDMQLGEHTNDYTELAANDKLSLLHLRIQQLVEQVEKIQKEQEYQRWREERFRQTSESTNQRVLWWSILQTFILVATGIWQMLHLKSFFKPGLSSGFSYPPNPTGFPSRTWERMGFQLETCGWEGLQFLLWLSDAEQKGVSVLPTPMLNRTGDLS
uniref:GOLD domain-containing protein n=1 Tax=Catagonus wagneri TaxID=51154 RepID=A0A8C3VPJ2_9CETA